VENFLTLYRLNAGYYSIPLYSANRGGIPSVPRAVFVSFCPAGWISFFGDISGALFCHRNIFTHLPLHHQKIVTNKYYQLS
jgi:hypothetical protein